VQTIKQDYEMGKNSREEIGSQVQTAGDWKVALMAAKSVATAA
jgi:hypothetical protein